MTFFDLSIPYTEKTGSPVSDTHNHDSRLQTTTRVMELGYTAIAYNCPFRGILSDADICHIVPFDAETFLESKMGPSLAAFTSSVKLHRNLLNVPCASPFRQYTRITISIDSAAAASVLNIGNRLLRSYDLVAAWPVNQMAFDQACRASEVDIISLDFSQKLPFRLKLAMVQAAIKRGVHFEISYSHLIADCHARRHILSEAKRLGEWTRGKNLIISSSASSLNEVRGPHDVANLSTILLGLTMEQAKASVSRNCRTVVVNALRKKDCYFKEAIKIERILPEENLDSLGSWFKDWNDWDPISSGVDDLPSLDDMAKLFSTAKTHSKSQNAIDITSSINVMAPTATISSCAINTELDYSNGCHSSNEVDHNNVDHVYGEDSALVVKSVPNAANNETEPFSNENIMAIDAFENPCFSRTLISGGEHLSLTSLGQTIDYDVGILKTPNMGMENVEIIDQVDSVLALTETHTDVPNLLDCSFVGIRDPMSMVDNGSIITVEEHYLKKMDESEENISTSSDVQINDNPNMMKVHKKLVLSLESSASKDLEEMGGHEPLEVRLETSISDDVQVKVKLKNQQDSTATAGSTITNLLDGSAKVEVPMKISALSKNKYSNGFATKTKGKKKRVSSSEISELAVLSEDPSTKTKEWQYFLPENFSPLKMAEINMERQSIQLPANACGVNNAHLHKSGKHRFRGRLHHRGYLLPVKNFCKHMLFKKRTGRLRRGSKFL